MVVHLRVHVIGRWLDDTCGLVILHGVAGKLVRGNGIHGSLLAQVRIGVVVAGGGPG